MNDNKNKKDQANFFSVNQVSLCIAMELATIDQDRLAYEIFLQARAF